VKRPRASELARRGAVVAITNPYGTEAALEAIADAAPCAGMRVARPPHLPFSL
jgi:hypothetical protein